MSMWSWKKWRHNLHLLSKLRWTRTDLLRVSPPPSPWIYSLPLFLLISLLVYQLRDKSHFCINSLIFHRVRYNCTNTLEHILNASSSKCICIWKGRRVCFIMIWPSKRLSSLHRWNSVVRGYTGVVDNITESKKWANTSLLLNRRMVHYMVL